MKFAKKCLFIIFIVAAAAAAVFVYFTYVRRETLYCRHNEELSAAFFDVRMSRDMRKDAVAMARREDLLRLQNADYDSVYFMMIPYRDMGECALTKDFFAYYKALETVTATGYLRCERTLNEYLEMVFDGRNEVSEVFLELLPFRLDTAEELNRQIGSHQDTTFHVMLGAPSAAYWLSRSNVTREHMVADYRRLAEQLTEYDNVMLYFLGAEEWLFMNPDNYVSSLELNSEVAKHLALLTYCDKRYRVLADDCEEIFTKLEENIDMARKSPVGGDLSDWCLVFFGDSIIGNFSGSLSIPGAVAGLSGCQAYNMGIGGTTAAMRTGLAYPFPDITELFLKREMSTLAEKPSCQSEMSAYYSEEHDGKKLCFVIHYGANDYFNGQPMNNAEDPFDRTTYAGALRSGIKSLKESYPEAVIVVSSPVYVFVFSNGQEIMGEAGGRLKDYVESAERVAEDMGAVFMDNYEGLGLDASSMNTYNISDGVHLGDAGRFLYAQKMIELLESVRADAR